MVGWVLIGIASVLTAFGLSHVWRRHDPAYHMGLGSALILVSLPFWGIGAFLTS